MNLKKQAIIALLLMNIAFSKAQTINIDTIPKITINLNDVVVSANKVDETKKTVAQQIQVITGTEIKESQSQSTADLIASTGNVFVQKSQLGGGSPGIRGFEASRILLVVDGVRMNNLIYRSGHLQNIVTLDNNILSRVEVLFGPSSTIYGSDALGGVIHLYTKSPMLATDGKHPVSINLFSRYGSVDNEMTNHFDLWFKSKKIGTITSLTYSQFGDLMEGKNQNPFYTSSYGERPYYVERFNGKDSLVKNENKYLQVGSGYTQYDFLQKILFQQTAHLKHGINIQYSNSGDVPRYDRLTDPAGGGLKSAEWYYGPQTRLLVAYDLNLENTESKFQKVHFGVNYQSIEESRHNRNFGSSFKNNRIENVSVIGANLDFQKICKSHNFRFGAEMQLNNLTSTAFRENIVADTTTKLDTRFPDGINKMNNFAIYFSHTWQINSQLTLTDGIRAGYSSLHSTLVDTATQFHLPYTVIDQKSPVYSGTIGLINSPTEDLKLSLLLATGFRVPNVDDMSKIFGSAPGAVIVPNIDLKPERTINYEFGVTKIINAKAKWENYIYYTQFVDAIVTDVATFNGQDSIMYDGTLSQVYSNQNKGEAYSYGFSTNLVSQLNTYFKFNFGMNYTYGRIKTDSMDSPLDHVPPFMSRLQLIYTNNKFSSSFTINYNGAKKLKDYYLNGEDNEQYATAVGMPAWFTANFHASYNFCKMFSLQGGVDNMFDTQYRTFASGINAPGRNIFMAMRWHF